MANSEGILPLIRVAKTPHKDVIIRAAGRANSLRGNPLVVYAASARAGNVQFCLVKSMWTGPVEGGRRRGLPAQNGTAELDLFMGIFHCDFYCPEGPKSQISEPSICLMSFAKLKSFSLYLMAETSSRLKPLTLGLNNVFV